MLAEMDYNSSYVIFDFNKDTLNTFGTAFKEQGYNVKNLNLYEGTFDKSMHYNPLKYIRNEKDLNIFVDSFLEGTALCNYINMGRNEEFYNAERLYFEALVGAVCTEFPLEKRNLQTVCEIDGQKNMNRKHDLDSFFNTFEKEKSVHFAIQLYKNYKQTVGCNEVSVSASVSARLWTICLIDEFYKIIKDDVFELEKIGNEKTALFITLNDKDSTFWFLGMIMYAQLIQLLREQADSNSTGKLAIPIKYFFDMNSSTSISREIEKISLVDRNRNIFIPTNDQEIFEHIAMKLYK